MNFWCFPLSCSFALDRLQEADRALSQALHLGLADASLLREIGNCYVAVGRLEAAEGALRMSLAADINSSNGMGGNCAGGSGGGGGMGNPHTRRRLADVLSARNSTSQVNVDVSKFTHTWYHPVFVFRSLLRGKL